VKWSRLTLNLDPVTADLAKKQAKAQRRSFAAYVATLIEYDLAKTVREDPGQYTTQPLNGPKERPPDKSKRKAS